MSLKLQIETCFTSSRINAVRLCLRLTQSALRIHIVEHQQLFLDQLILSGWAKDMDRLSFLQLLLANQRINIVIDLLNNRITRRPTSVMPAGHIDLTVE